MLKLVVREQVHQDQPTSMVSGRSSRCHHQDRAEHLHSSRNWLELHGCKDVKVEIPWPLELCLLLIRLLKELTMYQCKRLWQSMKNNSTLLLVTCSMIGWSCVVITWLRDWINSSVMVVLSTLLLRNRSKMEPRWQRSQGKMRPALSQLLSKSTHWRQPQSSNSLQLKLSTFNKRMMSCSKLPLTSVPSSNQPWTDTRVDSLLNLWVNLIALRPTWTSITRSSKLGSNLTKLSRNWWLRKIRAKCFWLKSKWNRRTLKIQFSKRLPARFK